MAQGHDNNGNATSPNIPGIGAQSLDFDDSDKLTAISQGTTAVGYRYDALGRRIRKEIDDNGTLTTVDFARAGQQTVVEFANGPLAETKSYVLGLGLDRPVSMTVWTGSAAGTYTYGHNSLGSVTALSDSSGTLVESYSYKPYGNETIRDSGGSVVSESLVGNPYRFTGRRKDFEEGLYNYRNRYYRPEIGRFISSDPIGHWGDPGQLGLGQGYCGNNPVNFVDPMGNIEGGPEDAADRHRHADRKRGLEFGAKPQRYTTPWWEDVWDFLKPSEYEAAFYWIAVTCDGPLPWGDIGAACGYITLRLGVIGSWVGRMIGRLGSAMGFGRSGGRKLVSETGEAAAKKGATEAAAKECADTATKKGAIAVAETGTNTTARPIPRVGNPKPGMVELDVDKLIHTHPVPRPGHSVSEVSEKILEEGFDQLHAIPVIRLPDGRLVLGGGNHRLAAMRELGERTIPGCVTDWSSLSEKARAFYRKKFPKLFGGF